MKKCNTCGLLKALNEFYNKHARCKLCYKTAKGPYIEANREKAKEAKRKCYRRDPASYKERNDEWKVQNRERYRELKHEQNSKYWQNNKGKCKANCRAYETAKIQRMPKWLTKEQRKEIEELYEIAAELSWLSEGGLNVDHIVPLRGKNVSGLHVPWNLQVIPASENFSKRNKF